MSHASGAGAVRFFDALTAGERYVLVASFGPGWEPLCIPDWLGMRHPPDLLYVRSTFHIYARR